MTRSEIAAWQTWLARVELRCGADDVPVLVRRLGVALAELERRAVAEPVQLSLEERV